MCASTWGSFRDPDGRVVLSLEGPIRRDLAATGFQRAQAIAKLPSIQRYQQRSQWVEAEAVAGATPHLNHPRVFFPSYPHEWSAAMLHRAANLTLEANQALLEEGWELKDATPTNVLFEGTRPVFVDFLSPVQRESAQLGWRAYGQFARTFLIPLLLHQKRRIPLRWLYLAHRDGIAPDLALPILGPALKFHPAAFGLVTLPAWMGRKAVTRPSSGLPTSSSAEVATTITRRILKGLGRRLQGLAPKPPKASTWFDYQDLGISYTAEGLAAKEAFIAEALKTCQPATVLDLGCNTGKFSKLAARAGARVVALDSDPECVGRLFLEAEAEGLDIQPLVADLGRPSPRLGWDYREEYSLLDRLEARFDLTLALALVHHLLVRERVPMAGVAGFLARTTQKFAIIEWVPPEDPQFQRLAGPNGSLYASLTLEQFLIALGPWFNLHSKLDIPGCGRCLLALTRLIPTE